MKQIRMRGAAALLSLALTLPLMLPGWTARAAALEESGVAISEETFPDAAFRSWLTDWNNLNGFGSDGYFSAAELAEIKSIDVSGKGIQTLEGIEQFSALEQLSCENNRLKELDVKQNRALRHLQCRFNQIAALDVSGLDNLISLNCESNHMKNLNLTGCTALEIIYCRSNDLPEVDFSTNTSLKFIETFDNRLSSIDLSKLTALEFVHLDHNLLTHIDLSANTNLSPIGSGFVARNNQLDTLTLPVKADLVVDPDVYAEQDPKVGYERVEWYEDAEYHIPVTGPITANGQTLYAKWLPNDYTIRFNSNGGSGSMPEQSGVWDQKLTLEKNTFRRTGYAFQGWKNVFGDDAFYDDGSEVLNLTGKYQGQRVTLYAQWEPIQYTVAFGANGGQGEMAEESYRYDQSKNLPKCTMTGPDDKIFAGWATEWDGSVRYLDQSAVRNLA